MGFDLALYTRNHVCLDELSSENARQEVINGQEDLEKILGHSAKKSVVLPAATSGHLPKPH